MEAGVKRLHDENKTKQNKPILRRQELQVDFFER